MSRAEKNSVYAFIESTDHAQLPRDVELTPLPSFAAAPQSPVGKRRSRAIAAISRIIAKLSRVKRRLR
jgi:hypothetical protein